MLHGKSLVAIAFGLTAVALSQIPAAQADVIYTYTGNDFTHHKGAYTSSDNVTVSLTLAGPLADSSPITVVAPLAFSISDGLQTLSSPCCSSSIFALGTDASGAIDTWFIDVTKSLTNFIETYDFVYYFGKKEHHFGKDRAHDKIGRKIDTALVKNDPGIWVATAVDPPAVPEPGSLFLFGSGLLGLALLWRRRGKHLDLAQ